MKNEKMIEIMIFFFQIVCKQVIVKFTFTSKTDTLIFKEKTVCF